MATLKGVLDMLLRDRGFDKNFRLICRLIFDKLDNDPYYIGRTPQKLAYVIVSAVIDKYSQDHALFVTKQYLRTRLGLSLTSAEYTPYGGEN